MKKFDLNIDKILEDWDVEHAIREIIANAIDEQILTNTPNVVIKQIGFQCWSIRDFGRGIRYEHFVQNESKEKQQREGIIGKFGIGLKDAIATFYRKGVRVIIHSKFSDISIERLKKGDFEDIVTLHAVVKEPTFPMMEGTEFVLNGINESDIEKAKSFFLRFSTPNILEKTRMGEIIERKSNLPAFIYVNGVKIATEENFLFSYNITSINTQLRKSLNRERSNVGRTAYAYLVKSMLLDCTSENVIDLLSKDLRSLSFGNCHDELKWTDVQLHTSKLLNKREKVVFVTSNDMLEKNDLVHEAKRDSTIVVIPDTLINKIERENEIEKTTDTIRTIGEFSKERSANYEFRFVDIEELNKNEYKNYCLINDILEMVDGKPCNVRDIKIAKELQRDTTTFAPSEGLWRRGENMVVIKQSVLSDLEHFIGVLIHEIAHAKSGESDATRGFETQLTKYIGLIGYKYINSVTNNQ